MSIEQLLASLAWVARARIAKRSRYGLDVALTAALRGKNRKEEEGNTRWGRMPLIDGAHYVAPLLGSPLEIG